MSQIAQSEGFSQLPGSSGAAMAATFADWWGALAARNPLQVAVRAADGAVTIGELDARAAALAHALLAHGYGKGSRIGLLMGNGAPWIVAFLAIQHIGGLAVLLSTFFAPQELRHAVRHADVSLLLMSERYLGHDYAAALEDAFPTLTDQHGAAPLLLADCPYLRAVWSEAPSPRRWIAADIGAIIDQGATVAGAAPGLLDAVAAAVHPTDLCCLIYTSGSTALPKAVVHAQGPVVDKIRYLAATNAVIPSETNSGDCVLTTQPLFWVGGFLTCFGSLEIGASLAFAPSLPAPQLWAEVERYDAQLVAAGGEAILRAMQEHVGLDRPLSQRLKPQNSNQMAWFRAQQGYDYASIGCGFGMTETIGPHSGFHALADTYGALAGSYGPELGAMERRIIDPASDADVAPGEEGELAVRGPWLMAGYYKRPHGDCFDAAGWFRTGDLCRIDDAGNLHFTGRLSGMIKTSGANVAPEEVEVALRAREDVIEATVFGLPDPVRGQIVVAVVAPAPDAALDEATLRAWLKPRLSSYKIPRRFVFMPFDNMPRTSSNKIHRGDLARLVSDGAAGSVQSS